MGEDRRSGLGRSVRADRRAFWVQVLVGSVVAVGLVLLGIGLGLSPSLVGPLAVLVLVGLGVMWRSRRTDASSDPADHTTDFLPTRDGIRLTGFAFSETAPTWRGWRRDVGDVTIHQDKIFINGLQHQFILHSPFHAQLFRTKYLYWMMVETTGRGESGKPMTVYLVGMRAPKSKFAARPLDVENRGRELVAVINRQPHDPRH